MTTAACVSEALACAHGASQALTRRLVTAFGGALSLENPSRVLRDKVADYILAHPGKYSEVILGDNPQRYTTRMRQMDTWGGAIELSILSDIYDVEISSIDVKASILFFLPSPLNPSPPSNQAPVPPRRPLRRGQGHARHHPVLGDPLRPDRLLP